MIRMSMRAVGSFLVVAGLLPAGLGCSSAEDADSFAENEKLIITWTGAGAGLYVTDPEATAPDGPRSKVTGGTAYWSIEATSWPGGFDSPVTYGVVPEDAEDRTELSGGPKGGAPLEEGKTYKITIQGFGGDPAISEITWGAEE